MKKSLYLVAVLFVFASLLCSCASLQKQVTLDEGRKEHVVEMTLSNFKFEPNNFLTFEGDTVLFRMKNVTSKEHNFTLTDPSGAVLQDIDIPGNGAVEVKVTFTRTGTYYFYCDEPFHSALGMKGWIDIVRR